jgi:hypothetical protein
MQNVNKQLGNGSIIHRFSYYKHILVNINNQWTRKFLLNIVLQSLRFLSILSMFMVHDLIMFQVVFNHKQVWEFYKSMLYLHDIINTIYLK